MNASIASRLLALYEALQRRETTFGQVFALAAECGIDGRQVLRNHFASPTVIVGNLEA